MNKQSKRHSSSKGQAVQASRRLGVVPHKHTGHLTHHRTTSYPVLLMIVLCAGVFLAGWTRFVTADSFVYPDPISNSYVVHASVPGPPPSDPATIDVPEEGTIFTDIPITVSGTCPVGTYEVLYRNGAFSGVALCDATGHYELQTDLFPGTNQLQVRDFSQTDVPGPLSNLVTVEYNPPVPPTPPDTEGNGTGSPPGTGNSRSTTNTSGPIVKGEPLIFKTTYKYEGHYVGTASTWQLNIEGGNAPYAISVDWGDGQRTLISRARAGAFTLQHIYKKAGGYRGSYVTKFTASDADGNKAFLQLLAIVNNPPVGAGTGKKDTGATGKDTSNYFSGIIKFVWPSYLIVVLMLISFWLGERREYHHLKPRLKKARHARA